SAFGGHASCRCPLRLHRSRSLHGWAAVFRAHCIDGENTMRKPRALLYVQHLLGVGHVSRAAALTRGMLAAGIDVTVATGGEPVPAIGFGAAEVVQLPWLRAADTSFKTLLDAEGQ